MEPGLERVGYSLILIAAVLWSLIGVFSKWVLAEGVGSTEIGFWRAALAGAAFVVHAIWTGSLRLDRPADVLGFSIFGLAGVSLFYLALISAIETGGMSLAYFLLYTAPMFVALLAWLFLRERLTIRKLGLVSLAMVGVLLVARDSGRGVQVNVVSLSWGLLSGLGYASYYVFGKWILRRYRPETVYAFVLPIGALGLLPFVDFRPKSVETWSFLVLLALVSTYVAYLVYYTGLRMVPASRAVLVATVEPVLAAFLAWILFAERLGLPALAGGGCIVAAAALAPFIDRPRPLGSGESPGGGGDRCT